MFAWSRVDLPVPFEVVFEAMRGGPAGWVPELHEEPSGRHTSVVSVGGGLRRTVLVGLGPLESGDGWLMQSISLRAADMDVLFPVFAGELQATSLPDARTELALVGSYEPPLGPVGELVDRVVMHRLARQALAGFLARAGERVVPEARKQPSGRPYSSRLYPERSGPFGHDPSPRGA